MKPRCLILRAAGTNCDGETAHAFTRAGADANFLHINRLLENPRLLRDYQLLAIPGGFSYGDDIAAGKILANQITHHLRDALADFVAAGKPVIGICNGFQVLVKTDLLPGPLAGRSGQLCTLTNNDSGRFVDRWIHLVARSEKCIWTRGVAPSPRTRGEGWGEGQGAQGVERSLDSRRHSPLSPALSPDYRGEGVQTLELPIAHGEGKFIPADEKIRRALWHNDQVALIYARPTGEPADHDEAFNPNGSTDDIAGICDATGLVFGLMPHPERFIEPFQHPAWTRRPEVKEGTGLQIFRNAVAFAAG